jgi:hypothetical protein
MAEEEDEDEDEEGNSMTEEQQGEYHAPSFSSAKLKNNIPSGNTPIHQNKWQSPCL